MPAEISGGMKQRVGIARALAMQPKVLIMDEPFGALDALTRAQLQDVTMRLQLELGNTVIMVTHDVDEAVLLADRIVMMNNGPSATIGQIVDVNIERPRDRLALAEDPVYNHCRHLILDFLYAAHSHPETEELASQASTQQAGNPSRHRSRQPEMKPLVICGGGMAAMRLVKELKAVEFDDPIVVVCEEAMFGYNRVLLPDFLAGKRSLEELRVEQEISGHQKLSVLTELVGVELDVRNKTLIYLMARS